MQKQSSSALQPKPHTPHDVPVYPEAPRPRLRQKHGVDHSPEHALPPDTMHKLAGLVTQHVLDPYLWSHLPGSWWILKKIADTHRKL